MATISTGPDTAAPTWVEAQRERLERASDRTPGHLLPEDGIGAGVGATFGLVAGLLVALLAIVVAGPVTAGTAMALAVVGGVVGMVFGGVVGALLVGAPAHQARAEFDDLLDTARHEAPVAAASQAPPQPVEAGRSVFDEDGRRH